LLESKIKTGVPVEVPKSTGVADELLVLALTEFAAIVAMSALATGPNDPAPPALPWYTVVVVPSDPSDDGATPAPPPSTSWLATSTPEDAIELVELKYGTPPDVPDDGQATPLILLHVMTPALLAAQSPESVTADAMPEMLPTKNCPFGSGRLV